jgi:hypothetical protein
MSPTSVTFAATPVDVDVVEQCGAVQYYLILLVLAGGCGCGMDCVVGGTSISISMLLGGSVTRYYYW